MEHLSTILMSVVTMGLVVAYVFYGIPRRFAKLKERIEVPREQPERGESPSDHALSPQGAVAPDAELGLDTSDLLRLNALRASRGLHPLTELPVPARSLESLTESAAVRRPVPQGFLARYAAARRTPERRWGWVLSAALAIVAMYILLFSGPGR